MAKLWIVYREGLRLLGAPVGGVKLDEAVSRLDLAPWRLFTREAPDQVETDRLATRPGRKRALIEVSEEDRGDLCGLDPGFFESPYSPEEVRRRLGLAESA